LGGGRMNQQHIYFLFKSKNFIELINSHSIKEIVQVLSFDDALKLAYNLLYNEKWDENLQEYAIKLLYEIRNIHQNRWNASWEHDALLGLACYIRYKHEERYEAYKKAFDKAENPPPRLLIELARCCICPGRPPISYDEAINLIMNALKEAPYTDGISLLCNIYSLKDDKVKEIYWNNILKKIDKNLNSPSIEPKFLVDEYLKENK
jgi:tetratricopeptide (TPR) repeat protein